MAHLAMFFQNSCIAHVSINWLSPVKLRQTLIGGSRNMIVYDDVEATDHIFLPGKHYNQKLSIHRWRLYWRVFESRRASLVCRWSGFWRQPREGLALASWWIGGGLASR